jgi:hypothetical protein
MNTPVPLLMKHYSTEDVFLSKTADGGSLLAQLTVGLLNLGMAESNEHALRKQLQDNDALYEAVRELELAKMRQATAPLKGEASGAEMTRLASVAAGAGADMAIKEAGIGDFVASAKALGTKAFGALKGLGADEPKASGKMLGRFGLKTNLAIGATGLGAAYLGSKAINAGTRELARTPQGPAVYGGQVRGMGYQLPYGVNQYGQPQVGTPLG